LAWKWANQLGEYPNLDAAQAADNRIWGKRFADGQWVFGLSQDSHGSPLTGGTVVVKDSRDGVRVFFGHVCGGPSRVWWDNNFARSNSLDELYADWAKRGFKEYKLPAG
jgi:hypothetical protein